jgi:hypothetical protein
MRDLGEAKLFLGIEISRDRNARELKISQGRYIKDVLARFEMSDANPASTPMEERLELPKLEEATVDRTLYQCGVGSLMYAMLATRPDLAFTVGLLSQHNAAPGQAHWSALKRALRYLRGTIDHGITYRGSGGDSVALMGFADADFAGDKLTSRSTGGWAFTLAGGAIAWSSRKQTTIALSSTEAEYMAECAASRHASWARSFLNELGFSQDEPTKIFVDNQPSMSIAEKPTHHAHTKHIRVQFHYVRELIELGDVKLSHVTTDEQPADIFTKSLGRLKFLKFRGMLGIA